MMMSFFLHDSLDEGSTETISSPSRPRSSTVPAQREEPRILREKLRPPQIGQTLSRPRLADLLDRSLEQSCATLVSGRAGTGKTVLAAEYARRHRNTGWLTVEASDSDWNTFAAYFAECVADAAKGRPDAYEAASGSEDTCAGEKIEIATASDAAIAQFLVSTFTPISAKGRRRFLIVLDDLHKIFDAEWFGRFFHLLLYSLPENCRLLLLCRSKPPAPLWRLRSKQMLNVIDEKLLAFNPAETAQLFKGKGLTQEEIAQAQTESFGRVSKMVQLLSR